MIGRSGPPLRSVAWGKSWTLRPSCGAIDDERNRPAAVRSLVLGAAGDVDLRVPDEARERAADEGAGVAGRGNVGIVEHGVAVAAQSAVVARLGLAEERDQAGARARRQLPGGIETEPPERAAHRIDVDRV